MMLLKLTILLSVVTVFLPLQMQGQDPPPPPARTVTDIRIDNIPLDQLDGVLERAGMPKEARDATVQHERDRRGKPDTGGGESSSDMFSAKGIGAWTPCTCGEGAGASYWWRGGGTLQSHFRMSSGAVTPWTAPWQCPQWTICSVVTMIQDGPGRLSAFQASATIGPYYDTYRCNASGFG